MAKKKTAKKTTKKTAKKKSQGFINDDIKKDLLDEEIEDAAEEYQSCKTARAALATEEHEAQQALHALMKKKKKRTYNCKNVRTPSGDLVRVECTKPTEASVKLTKIKKTTKPKEKKKAG